MNQPQAHEYPQWFKNYITLVPTDVLATLSNQAQEFSAFMLAHRQLADFAYAPQKWTLKEVLGHIIDTERIMVFRLLSIARGEKAALPGFSEEDYVNHAQFAQREFTTMCEEFKVLRNANLFLIKSLNTADLNKIGIANNHEISVRAIVFILAGHVIHHQNVIKERYL